jgi:RNA polymerase sigma-B factor
VIEGLQGGEAYYSSSLDELLGDQGDTTVSELMGQLDNDLAVIEDREALRPSLAQLSPRERAILTLQRFRQLTQTQIAERLGISQMHVSEILNRTAPIKRHRLSCSPSRSCVVHGHRRV